MLEGTIMGDGVTISPASVVVVMEVVEMEVVPAFNEQTTKTMIVGRGGGQCTYEKDKNRFSHEPVTAHLHYGSRSTIQRQDGRRRRPARRTLFLFLPPLATTGMGCVRVWVWVWVWVCRCRCRRLCPDRLSPPFVGI